MSLLLALALAVAEPAEALHGGLSAGAGFAYDLAGIRVELGNNHFGVYAGWGLLSFGPVSCYDCASGGGSLSIGARWYAGVRRGWFGSLNFSQTWWSEYVHYDPPYTSAQTIPGHISTATAVAGYRFLWSSFFVEVGLGGGVLRFREPSVCGGQVPPNCVASLGKAGYRIIPDAVLGLGFEL